MIPIRFMIILIGAYFVTGCGVRIYDSEAQCESHIGKKCQQACDRMECSNVSGGKCFSQGNDWDWFFNLKDPGVYKFNSGGMKYPLLMIRQHGKMYLLMKGDMNKIQPGYGLRPTIATPPSGHRYFRPNTFSALESEGFQCASNLREVWISNSP